MGEHNQEVEIASIRQENLEAATPVEFAWIAKSARKTSRALCHPVPTDLHGGLQLSGLRYMYYNTHWPAQRRFAVRLANGQIVLARPKAPERA